MTKKIPIAGYWASGLVPVLGHYGMKTANLHWSWVYSYLFFRPTGIIVFGRFLWFKQRIDVRFRDVMSCQPRRVFPVGCGVRLDLRLGRRLDVFVVSQHEQARIIQLLQDALLRLRKGDVNAATARSPVR